MRAFSVLLGTLTIVTVAFALPANSANIAYLADAFIRQAVAAKALCTLEQNAGRSLSACIAREHDEVQMAYTSLQHQIRASTGKAALKSFYATWLSAMDGLAPRVGEEKVSFDARQEAADSRLNDLGNELRVEAGG